DEEEGESAATKVMGWLSRALPFTESWDHGTKLRAIENGKRVFTPMFLVIIALGTIDLLFALDSIPAIFGLTQDPFLVLMANIFALMGLRQLYFLIGNLLVKLVYLGLGLAVLLAFIGLKLIFHAMHVNELSFINGGEPFEWAPEIPIWLSLTVIIGIPAITAVLSLMKSNRDAKRLEVEQLSVHAGFSPGFYDQDDDTPGGATSADPADSPSDPRSS